jgi:virginiamycin B lyase
VAFEIHFTATALVLGENDELWATEAGTAIHQIHPYVSNVPYPNTPTGALTLGPDKNVWFPTAGVIAQQIPDQDPRYFSIGISFADQVCTGPDGAIWFTDGRRSQIGRLVGGKSVQTFDLPIGSAPTRIITGPDGALWFIAEGADKIDRINVTGDVLTQYPIPTSGGMPYALTVGGDHNIWFTERSSGKIGRLIPDPQ